MNTGHTPDTSEMNMSQEDAHALAKEIRMVPGWQAKAFLGMWPRENGVYGGGWVVAATRAGDENTYLLKAPDEWGVLQAKLAAGITPENERPGLEIHAEGGAICATHDRPFMPLGWPGKVPAIGEPVNAWACPMCAGTMPD